MRSSDEIDTEKVEKEKALRDAEGKLGDAKDIKNKLEKDILRLRLQKKEADILYDGLEFQCKRLRSDIRILTAEFWRTKNEGM